MLGDNLELGADEVHLWLANLNRSPATETYLSVLSAAELARANRFRMEHHRQYYISAHGILRILLSHYLKISPAQLQIEFCANGKPVLAQLEVHCLNFNLAHSHEWGLIGVTRDRAIGVDLEQMRPISDLQDVANRFFTPEEQVDLQRRSSAQKQQVFFRYWTCKEAYLKATGDGLSKLRQAGVKLCEHSHPRLQLSEASADWTLHELEPVPDYFGAVVRNGAIQSLKCFEWNGLGNSPEAPIKYCSTSFSRKLAYSGKAEG